MFAIIELYNLMKEGHIMTIKTKDKNYYLIFMAGEDMIIQGLGIRGKILAIHLQQYEPLEVKYIATNSDGSIKRIFGKVEVKELKTLPVVEIW
jgi:hypothetical protein